MLWRLAMSLLRQRNRFLTVRCVGTSWRSPPQQFAAISSARHASSKPSRFRRNALLAERVWGRTISTVFTFQTLIVKVSRLPINCLLLYTWHSSELLISSNAGSLDVPKELLAAAAASSNLIYSEEQEFSHNVYHFAVELCHGKMTT